VRAHTTGAEDTRCWTHGIRKRWPLHSPALPRTLPFSARSPFLRAVTGMNPRVDLGGYLTAHILPELSVAVSPAVDPSNPAAGAGAAAYAAAAVNELPIAKAAALKFITTFRAQFSREQLVALLPMVVPFAGANSFVVHTYAANCFERVLTIKDKKQESSEWGRGAHTAQPRITACTARGLSVLDFPA